MKRQINISQIQKSGVIICLVLLLVSHVSAQPPKDPFDPQKLAKSRDYWPSIVWKTAKPESQGMVSQRLEKAEQMFREILPSSYSLIVIRHGYIVLEQYYHGHNQNTTNHIFSITKSFTSALTGICVKKGYIKSIDQKMLDFFPEYVTPEIDIREKNITIKHLLTHTSGLIRRRNVKNKWLEATVKGRIVSNPGEKFSYSNEVPDILSGIITKTTGTTTLEFAERELFKPLGITIKDWKTTPDGLCMGGNGLYMTTRDLAKLGYLYLNFGYWDGKQILSPQWVIQTSQMHAIDDHIKAYGYLFWVRQEPDNIQGHHVTTYFAYGHRGQYIGITPALDLLVVMSADAKDATRNTFFVPDLIHDYVRRYIFSAITDIK